MRLSIRKILQLFIQKKEYILNLNNRDFVTNAPWSSTYSFFFFFGALVMLIYFLLV